MLNECLLLHWNRLHSSTLSLSLCSVMRQPYDFTYPRPWSESLQTGDSDELIIPLSCNYPPPHSLSLSLLILLFPSQSLLSFVCSLYISFSRLNLSPCLRALPSFFPLYTNIYDYTQFVLSMLFLLCIYCSLCISNLLLLPESYGGNSGRLQEWEYSLRVPRFI